VRTILSQRRSVSFLSTIGNTGTVRFMVLKKAIDSATLIRFFTRLRKDAGRKVFVFLDNLNVHKARDVRTWVDDHAAQVALFYLPSYSPELNPDEYLNGDRKLRVAKRAPARDRDALLRTATSRLRSLQQQPERVKKFFQHPRVRYAA
jgi:transposase